MKIDAKCRKLMQNVENWCNIFYGTIPECAIPLMQIRDNIVVCHVKVYQPIYIIMSYIIVTVSLSQLWGQSNTMCCTPWACAAYALTFQVFTWPFIWKTASSPIIMFERNCAGLPNNQLQWSVWGWRSLCSKAWHHCIQYGWIVR